jgi:hypothetical protein
VKNIPGVATRTVDPLRPTIPDDSLNGSRG